jgi:hypothetical protein
LLEPLLDFEDPLERLDPDETERAGDELLEPELDLVTLGVLPDLDLLLPEELERVTDDFLDPELDLVTLEVLLERLPLDERVRETVGFLLVSLEMLVEEDRFRVGEELYPEPELLP